MVSFTTLLTQNARPTHQTFHLLVVPPQQSHYTVPQQNPLPDVNGQKIASFQLSVASTPVYEQTKTIM